MSNFMNRYFSIAFMFVVAASFIACNYIPEDESPVEELATQTFESQVSDSTATIPFDIDSIKTVSQLLDSLNAVQVN